MPATTRAKGILNKVEQVQEVSTKPKRQTKKISDAKVVKEASTSESIVKESPVFDPVVDEASSSKTSESTTLKSVPKKGKPKETPGDIEDVIPDGLRRFNHDFPIILEMRKGNDAPVDSIGCHMLADRSADIDTQHFQTLVALLLSPRVKDSQTAIAMAKLKEHGLTVPNIIETPVETIKGLIAFIGLAQTKAERLKKCAQILHDSFGDKVPNDYQALLALPGVGHKIAGLVMVSCFDSEDFIGVDTHVHRISNMLKWIKTKTPEGSDDALKKLVPRDKWRRLNVALVGFGQTICKAPKPQCYQCLLKETCPFPNKNLKRPVSS